MTDTLRRIQAKVTRAKQLIQDLQVALTAFHETKPYAVAIKEDTQAGKRIYYVAKSDPIPDHVAAIAADAIQNLRSPLDQTAYQLVLDARGGIEPKWRVYYPVCGNAKDYPALRQNFIRGVRQQVLDAIDATEPYNGGKGHTIWQLNELSKPDKHKLLVSAGAFSAGVEIMPPKAFMESAMKMMGGANFSFPSIFLTPADKLLALKVGDELYIEPLDLEAAPNRRFTFDVSFNQPSVIECEAAIKTLQDMANVVDGVVGTLGKFLP
jgi:hypothetical protein